ncbi:MAG: ATP-binding cassette domain-containing protein [Segniliparus sp.]|uniref:ATP-binding cassette domain-containing protein n=1 Tax=Segniliparus sp. TaxID=2804064 RepID=UPI003F3AF858
MTAIADPLTGAVIRPGAAPAPGAVPAVEVRGLTKSFRGNTVVSDLSFSVLHGAVTGFLGPNGSGKSTTLRAILGLVRPDAGQILVEGSPLASTRNPGRVVAGVLDASSMHPNRKAVDHLKIYCAALGVPDSKAADVLEAVGLSPAAAGRPKTYSLGMRQRLAIATALLGDPRILILDEPANGLDPAGLSWLRGFLRAFARAGGAALMSSHLLREVEQTIDHLVVISQGRVVFEGSLETLRGAHATRTYVASADPEALAAALRERGAAGVEPTSDGRLLVTGPGREEIAEAAAEAQIALFGQADDSVGLEQLYTSLVTPQYLAREIRS